MKPVKGTSLTGALLAALLTSFSLVASPSYADSLTVNNTADPGDGDCNPDGGCTLREAINEANTTTIDTIRFDIPGSGVKTISPASSLPTISEPLTIDGYSQPGASDNTSTTGTNANGNTGTFTFKPDNKVPAGQNVTATATRDSTGDTSEFSASEEVE